MLTNTDLLTLAEQVGIFPTLHGVKVDDTKLFDPNLIALSDADFRRMILLVAGKTVHTTRGGNKCIGII